MNLLKTMKNVAGAALIALLSLSPDNGYALTLNIKQSTESKKVKNITAEIVLEQSISNDKLHRPLQWYWDRQGIDITASATSPTLSKKVILKPADKSELTGIYNTPAFQLAVGQPIDVTVTLMGIGDHIYKSTCTFPSSVVNDARECSKSCNKNIDQCYEVCRLNWVVEQMIVTISDPYMSTQSCSLIVPPYTIK